MAKFKNQNLKLKDNQRIYFGDSDDTSIRFDGTNLVVTGGIAETNGVLKQNLLTNSGFGVWSNSTVENVGAAVKEDDCADDDTVDWTHQGDSLTFDTDHYEFAATGVDKHCYYSGNVAFTSGKLYQISVSLKNGTASGQTVKLYADDGVTSFLSATKTTTGSFVVYTYVIEATGTTAVGNVGIKVTSNPAGNNIEFKNFSLFEVTPGCIAADTLAMDGWKKGTSVDIWREHTGSNTKDGEFYSLKILGTADPNYEVHRNISATARPTDQAKFYGRTVTMGAWVKTDAASQVRLNIYNGGDNFSSLNTGSNWEWLEVTATLDTTNNTQASFWVANTKTAYISQPMLVFGNSIGEGNYTPMPQEIIWFETSDILTNYEAPPTITANASINLEAQSDCKVPKGIQAVYVLLRGASGSLEKYLYLSDVASGAICNEIWSIVANINNTNTSWVKCDSSGDIYLTRNDGFADVYIYILAVQLR